MLIQRANETEKGFFVPCRSLKIVIKGEIDVIFYLLSWHHNYKKYISYFHFCNSSDVLCSSNNYLRSSTFEVM